MATLSSAHFVDSDISGTASGGDSWQSNQSTDAVFYSVAFDGGDENNPIEKGDGIENYVYDFANDTWATIGTDDKGGNDLGTNSMTEGTNLETTDYKRGTACVNLVATSDFMNITDTNLDSGFPLKSGESNSDISVSAWVKYDVLGNYDVVLAKYDLSDKRSFAVSISDDTSPGTYRFRASIGHTNGTLFEVLTDSNVAVIAGRWYHVGFTFNDSTRAWKFRIYDDNASTAYSDSGTATNNISITTAPVTIGRWTTGGYFDGKIDQISVFSDILTNDEIDLIRTGYFPQDTGTCVNITYDDSSTGTITYALDSGSTQFSNNQIIQGGGNTVTINGTPATATSPLTQDRTTAFLQDWAHLEGQSVAILDNGVVVTGRTISSGAVSGDALTTPSHVGLGYTSTLKPSKLDIEGMGWVLTKKITKAILSFYNSLRGKYGLNTSTMYDVSTDTALFTGIKELPFRGQYEREGDIVVQQTEPLPLVCRGIILNAGIHEVK
jgi:hypothetical protein